MSNTDINKHNSLNDKSFNTNYIIDKKTAIQNYSERDEYKNMIYYPSASKE